MEYFRSKKSLPISVNQAIDIINDNTIDILSADTPYPEEIHKLELSIVDKNNIIYNIYSGIDGDGNFGIWSVNKNKKVSYFGDKKDLSGLLELSYVRESRKKIINGKIIESGLSGFDMNQTKTFDALGISRIIEDSFQAGYNAGAGDAEGQIKVQSAEDFISEKLPLWFKYK